MSTSVWPPIDAVQLIRREEESLARELAWLLASLQETFAALKSGLEDCATLLSPDKGPSTLVLSSLRSESLKGFVTRIGTRIVKGDVNLRLHSLPPPKGSTRVKLSISSAPQAPTLALEQLTNVRTLINASLDIIDVSRWTGDSNNADFISGQLRLLCENMQEAKHALKGELSDAEGWCHAPLHPDTFEPPLPANVSFHLSISEAALLLHIRVLEPAASTPDAMAQFRERFAALSGSKIPPHDEMGQVFDYRGRDVTVKEKLRVESQDPSLLSAMAKLGALEHSAAMSRKALDTVMGKDD